jgi:hypothetical protein
VAVASVVLVLLAVWLVPWDWVPGGRLVPASPHEVFTTEQLARAEEYSAGRRYLGWASYGVSLVVALVLGLTCRCALVRRLSAAGAGGCRAGGDARVVTGRQAGHLLLRWRSTAATSATG